MNFIEKHSKILAVALCFCACGPVLSTVYAYETKPGWHGEGADRYYILESNHQTATGLTEVDSELYYFNDAGEMQFGWQEISNDTYYFEEDGTAATGKTNIQGTTYNFQDEGKLQHGWSEDGKSYFDEKGFKVSKAWVEEDGFKYYFDSEGNMLTGWQELDGNKYYFGEDGKMTTGEVEIDGKKYYLQEDGTFKTGWVEKDGKKFYFDENGNLIKDSLKDIDGKKYAFDANGELIKDAEKDGYKVNSDGVVEEIVEQAPEQKPAQPESNTAPQSKPNKPAPAPQPAPQPAPAPSVNTSAIVAAAYAQLGRTQDCTALVSNSLAAVGINFHGWPEDYLSLGTLTSNPVPGDIVVYSGHVAIFVGGGQAIHGGWLGNQTVVGPVNCGNGLIGYVHIG